MGEPPKVLLEAGAETELGVQRVYWKQSLEGLKEEEEAGLGRKAFTS